MHYYSHNIDEFRSLTINMSREARWLFRDMLDIIYRTEEALPDDLNKICRSLGVRSEEEKAIVAEILLYEFVQVDGGYMHPRAAEQISAYHDKADKARANGKSGGRRKTNPVSPETNPEPEETKPVADRFDSEPTSPQQPSESQANCKPITKNQELITKEEKRGNARASRLPADWSPSEADELFCQTERPDLRASEVAARFRDYWTAQPGAKGRKTDWPATWRNWVRNERKQADARASPSSKFHLAGVDRSGDAAIAEASRKRHGIEVDLEGEIEL
jgi:uncharacterized protein YdaU (DUF1376 family)